MKHPIWIDDSPVMAVAPRAGAWIETPEGRAKIREAVSRPPRGGVD